MSAGKHDEGLLCAVMEVWRRCGRSADAQGIVWSIRVRCKVEKRSSEVQAGYEVTRPGWGVGRAGSAWGHRKFMGILPAE